MRTEHRWTIFYASPHTGDARERATSREWNNRGHAIQALRGLQRAARFSEVCYLLRDVSIRGGQG